MVQIIQPTGSIASQIGANLGKGLSEQLPKEVERFRLSQGLQQINDQGQMAPLAQIQHLLRSGASMQDIGALLPFIQQAQGREALKKRAAGEVGQKAAQPSGIAGQAPSRESYVPEGKGGFASQNQLDKYRSSILQKPSQHDINQLASELIDLGATFDTKEALAMAEKELEKNLSSQEEQLSKFQTDLSNRISTILQNAGIGDFKDIPGIIQQKLLDEGSYRLGALGQTSQKASADISKIAQDLGEKATQAKTTGSFNSLTKPAKSKISEWKASKKLWDDYGLGQYFDEIVSASSDLTPMQVAHELNPIENKEINNELKKYKIGKFEKIASALTPLEPEIKKMKQKDLDKIVDNIKPGDNLQSIAYELRERNLDVDQFFDALSKSVNENKKGLTPDQQRQQGQPRRNSFLGDILFRTFR